MVRDAYSLQRIDETVNCLNGLKSLTALDLKLEYWQVELDEASKPLMAFTVGPLGIWFRLTNTPETFQRFMETCLGGIHLNLCIIYLDDIIIFLKTPKEHLQRLSGVLEKLSEAGLKLKPSKCEFLNTHLSYLGHVVSEMVQKLTKRKKKPSPSGQYLSGRCKKLPWIH